MRLHDVISNAFYIFGDQARAGRLSGASSLFTFQEAAANLECGFLRQKPPSNTQHGRRAATRSKATTQRGESRERRPVVNQLLIGK